MRMILLAVASALQLSCASAALETNTQNEPVARNVTRPGGELILVGGAGNTFLGCLSCATYEEGSLLNANGPHGNRYGVDSIFNGNGAFGSPHSSTSACNPEANDPPSIVDEGGRFYGRLTLNPLHAEAIRNPGALSWLRMACGL
jgi:hypothetical protein